MAVENVPLIAFNRGLVSKLGLARVDLKRTALSAEIHNNMMPRVLGSMMLRPGLGFLGDTRNDLKAFYLDFVFNLNDKALIELTDQKMRVWVNDALITRVAVGTAVTNGDFAVNLAGWTDDDEAGAVSAWTNFAGGEMELIGSGTAAAIRTQQVAVAGADQGKEHALRIVIPQSNGTVPELRADSPVTIKVGSTNGADDYINETQLGLGVHSLAFTPTTASFWIQLSNRRQVITYVSQCTIEAAGVMEIPTPWLEADLPLVRYDASADVTYLACASTTISSGYEQRKIERRSTTSWSIVVYEPEDGPFQVENVSTTTITASAITGNITLTASTPIFKTGHLSALFRLTSIGQTVTKLGAALNDATAPLQVTGVGTDRAFTIVLSGFFDGVRTMIVEQAFDPAGPWTAVPTLTWTAAVTTSFNDGLDNQIIYYRLRISVLGGAGNTTLTLSTGTGSITGIVRVIQIISTTVVLADVLTALGSTAPTEIWSEGSWSTFRGFPSSVALHGGRLVWAGKSFCWGSISDGFESFDDTVEGDSGTFARSIGSGPVDNINWLSGLQRLLMGADMAEQEVATSSLDEPITPTNFSIRPASTQGSHTVAAVKLDNRAIYASRGGTRVFELGLDPASGDYSSVELTAIVPDLFEDPDDTGIDRSIVRLGVQRKPDTRIHCVRADGTVAIMIYDRVENVACWIDFETAGDVEDVVVLPGPIEDQVYYSVKRTINGATKRYLERWAKESEARGRTTNKMADAGVQRVPVAGVVSNLGHLEGQQVTVWADGIDVGYDANDNLLYTVAAGQITLATAAASAFVGLPYTGKWKAAKLSYAAQLGTALTQMKDVSGLAMVLHRTHARALKYGPDFDHMDRMPSMEAGKVVDPDSIWEDYDKVSFEFPGEFSSDPRICLQALAPRCATIMALVPTISTSEKID